MFHYSVKTKFFRVQKILYWLILQPSKKYSSSGKNVQKIRQNCLFMHYWHFTGHLCFYWGEFLHSIASVGGNMAIRKQCSQHIFELLYNYIYVVIIPATQDTYLISYMYSSCAITMSLKLLKAFSNGEKTGSIATSTDRSRFNPRESERSKGNVAFLPVGCRNIFNLRGSQPLNRFAPTPTNPLPLPRSVRI